MELTDIDPISLLWIFGMAAGYLTRLLVFDSEHESVFPSKKIRVVSHEWDIVHERMQEIKRRADLTDRIRRLFGAYIEDRPEDVDYVVWYHNDLMMRVWLCSFCLSFWITLCFSWTYFFILDDTLFARFLFWFVAHFASAGIAFLVQRT